MSALEARRAAFHGRSMSTGSTGRNRLRASMAVLSVDRAAHGARGGAVERMRRTLTKLNIRAALIPTLLPREPAKSSRNRGRCGVRFPSGPQLRTLFGIMAGRVPAARNAPGLFVS